jgi:hypothetical protein
VQALLAVPRLARRRCLPLFLKLVLLALVPRRPAFLASSPTLLSWAPVLALSLEVAFSVAAAKPERFKPRKAFQTG